MIGLLDLPAEILLVIFQHFYGKWSIQLTDLALGDDGGFKLKSKGMPEVALLRVCKPIYEMCRRIEKQTFTGRVWAVEHMATLGMLPQSFVDNSAGSPRCRWIRSNLRILRFTNGHVNPAVWRIYLNWEDFPCLGRVELDCRYHTHFAIHNVESFDSFIKNETGELEKCMDFRRSFFLSCEKFCMTATSRRVKVAVIRAMGVREGRQLCQAVVVAVDYVQDQQGRLVLDMANIKTQSRPIFKWPQGIKPALAALTAI